MLRTAKDRDSRLYLHMRSHFQATQPAPCFSYDQQKITCACEHPDHHMQVFLGGILSDEGESRHVRPRVLQYALPFGEVPLLGLLPLRGKEVDQEEAQPIVERTLAFDKLFELGPLLNAISLERCPRKKLNK